MLPVYFSHSNFIRASVVKEKAMQSEILFNEFMNKIYSIANQRSFDLITITFCQSGILWGNFYSPFQSNIFRLFVPNIESCFLFFLLMFHQNFIKIFSISISLSLCWFSFGVLSQAHKSRDFIILHVLCELL